MSDVAPAGYPVPCPEMTGAARHHADEAAERIALGLLRAAMALERCADKCVEPGAVPDGDLDLRQRAEEYVRAASRYREMAERYRNLGGGQGVERIAACADQ